MDQYGEGTPKQRVANFDKMHGGDMAVCDDTWVYFPDGAVREIHPLGALMEPPENPRERHQKIVYYHKLIVERAVREFDAFKNKLRENPGAWPDAEKNLAELQMYADEVKDCQKDLESAKAELEKYLPGYVPPEERAARAAQDAATAEAKSRYAVAIDAIQI